MSRFLRFLPLLLVCSFASAVMAQSADVSVTLTMDSRVVYDESGWTSAAGKVAVTNSGTVPAQNATIDFDKSIAIDLYSLPGFTCAFATDHYRCTAASMAPGTLSINVGATWRGQLAAGTVETTTVTVSSVSPADPNTTNNSASASTTITWSADLQLEYVDSFTGIQPGSLALVGVNVVDYGPSPASDFKMTFTIPPGGMFEFVDTNLAVEQPSCTTPAAGQSGDVVCTLHEWRREEGHAAIYVGVQVGASTPPGTLTLNATISSSDALKSPQSATGTIQVVAPADLSVAMTSPPTVKQGDSYDNIVVVTNAGPGPAINTYLGVSFSGAATAKPPTAPAGWTCSSSSRGANCRLDSFPPGTATFTFPGFVTSPIQATSTTQTASVSAYNDPNRTNNTVSTTTTNNATPSTDLGVSITATPTVVRPFDTQTYTIQVTNSGTNPALNVVVAAQLPGNVNTASCGTPGYSTCSFPTLDPGATVTMTFGIGIGSTDAGPITGYVSAWAENVSASKTASTTTQNAGRWSVDLQPTLVAPAAVVANAPSVWTIGVINNGPDPVHGWAITMSIGASVSSVTTTEPGVSCTGSGSYVRCDGTSLPNGRMTAQVTAVPTQAVHASVGTLASYIDLDRDPSNDIVSADSPIAQGALDLSLTLTADRSPITTGDNAVFHIRVANSGPLASSSHFVTVTLPPFFDLVSATSPCSRTNSTTVTCAYSPLAAGGIEEATLTLHPTRVGAATVTATVPTSTSEARTDNNTASASVVVLAMVDMSITLDAAPTALQTGDNVTYTISAKNVAGAAAASNVVVNLDLPSSLAFVSASPQCSGGPRVTCSAGTLAGDTPVTFTVVARALEAGTIKVLAGVSSASEESNNGNNTAAATIVVSAPPPPPPPSRRRAARH